MARRNLIYVIEPWERGSWLRLKALMQDRYHLICMPGAQVWLPTSSGQCHVQAACICSTNERTDVLTVKDGDHSIASSEECGNYG